MASRSSLVLLMCAAVLLVAATLVHAQPTGTLSGTVTASDGGALPATVVELTGPARRIESTGSDGGFSIPGLPAGTYNVTIRLAGFRPSVTTVTVGPGAVSNIDIVLTPQPIITEEIRVRMSAGAERIGTNNLAINKDAATTTDLFNGSVVRTTVIDNTAAAQRDLTFDERATILNLGAVVLIQQPTATWSAGFKAGLQFEDESIALSDPQNQRTEIAGSGLGGHLGAHVRYHLGQPSLPSINQSLKFSFDGSLTTINDATRAPAQSSTGRVTSDSYDIKARRTFFDLSYLREAPTFSYSVGVRRYSIALDLDRSLDIDFSSVQAGVGLHADGRTELSKSGWQLGGGATYQATPRLGVTTSVAFGTDAWRIGAGVEWKMR